LVIEARKYSGLAVDTLVALARDGQTDNSRFSAAVELLNRGYGRPAQSLDLHLSADAITKRLSDMTDAELAALEQRMIAAPIVLEATAEVSDDAGDARQYSTRHGPSLGKTSAVRQSDSPVAVQAGKRLKRLCGRRGSGQLNPTGHITIQTGPPEPRQFRRYYGPSPPALGTYLHLPSALFAAGLGIRALRSEFLAAARVGTDLDHGFALLALTLTSLLPILVLLVVLESDQSEDDDRPAAL
jgi:hypothetical protein